MAWQVNAEDKTTEMKLDWCMKKVGVNLECCSFVKELPFNGSNANVLTNLNAGRVSNMAASWKQR